MTTLSRKHFLHCLALSALTLSATGAWAQSAWPDRPLKLVVPFAPGGATDVLGRLLATGLSEKLGQPVIVENRPGAGTVVGASMVAKAPPDGYTLMLGSNSTFTLNAAIRSNLPYDSLKSFVALGTVADMSLLLLANNDSGVRSVADLVQQAKAKPEKFSYASFGTGSSVHFGGEMLKSAAGIHMVHVPFNGSAPSLTALMGGQVQVSVDTVVASLPQIKAGKVRALATLSSHRLPSLPDVPTVAESGYPGFEAGSWFGLVAPTGLPAPVAQKIERTLAEVLKPEAMRKRLVDLGLTPAYADSAAMRARIEHELPAMRAVAARADIRAD
ncbi:tripartite-type tricarboxylate transporter receptor subunit TctC [Rhodoferax ferrireducens]|uniref:Tripartite-type tricarboxylate transporter receptor subunit TctC n=1 Tax=Rhodoferax ferrireducens TaxID=192843 RepID=A0ABU2C280_9BURK|nr:tripartite tricarboxylate transporter substrate binding protein [Rhodoferax ferrireducens]MDR7375436.1 tripartite-type tricarboxylate transporter receptor subunit TctC [Rhodoferax ferrireducens]